MKIAQNLKFCVKMLQDLRGFWAFKTAKRAFFGLETLSYFLEDNSVAGPSKLSNILGNFRGLGAHAEDTGDHPDGRRNDASGAAHG